MLEQGHPVAFVMTLASDVAAKFYAVFDYAPLCDKYKIPLYYIRDINDDRSIETLKQFDLDLLFVIGWSQILQPKALASARIGVVGAHASLLPANRGSGPISWTLIKGETQTGNTLMWLSAGVDQGDVIDQTAFPITPHDTCATLYDRVAESNRTMILRLLTALSNGQRPGRPQPRTLEPLLPRRRPEHGIVNWELGSRQIYDFIRALTHPYPGAFSWLNGDRYFIWQCAVLPLETVLPQYPPGTVIGPVYSPLAGGCGQMVSCGTGAILLLAVEDAQGQEITGYALSEQQWQGKRWLNPVTEKGQT
ncbi:MAG: methionyl-tRNA formyltransferase [Magnetococcus sp. YQC-5]